MINSILKSQIDWLRNTFWSWGIANPLTAIEQISYLIFMKRLDELDKQNQLKAERVSTFQYNSHFTGTFSIGKEEYKKEELRRSHRIQMSADEMFTYVRDVVFPFIKTLHTEEWFAGNLKDASFLIPKASMLVAAVTTLENLRITEQNEDTTWDIYEYLLNEIASAGKNWQFRTPRHIIKMIVEIINPTKNDKVADLAAGTAWFLINAYKHILKENSSKDAIFEDESGIHYPADLLDEKDWKRLKSDWLSGFDFDSTMVRIALMNCIMHGISTPNIKYRDTLGKMFDHKPEYDVVLMNPPFKGSIDIWDINPDFTLWTTKTELLFMELIYSKLVVGWRCWVIVPDGVLFGSSNAHKKLRELLIENTDLKTVISLPSWVFKPYAWVSTAILIFTKWDETKKVRFYDLSADGFSLDDKRNPIESNDIPDVLDKYKACVTSRKYDKQPEKWDKWFRVDKEEIKNNNYDLSISKYKKIEYTAVKYEDPKVLINQIKELERSIVKGLDEVEAML